MSDFIIYPHKGYLNTEFKYEIIDNNIHSVRFKSKDDIRTSFIYPQKRIHSQRFDTPGVYDIYVNNEVIPRDRITVENAYKFGGSKLHYAYLSKLSSNAFLVMFDRMYIYNYTDHTCWMENGLTPDSIEDLGQDYVLFKTKRKIDYDDKTKTEMCCSVFSVEKKRIIFSFSEYIAHTEDYLIYKDSTDGKLSIFFYMIGCHIYVDDAAYVYDRKNDCIYFTKAENNIVYATKPLAEWEISESCLYGHADEYGEFIIDKDSLDEDKNPLIYECHIPSYGTFVKFSGTHYAVYKNKIVDLRNNQESAIPLYGDVYLDTKGDNASIEKLKNVSESYDDAVMNARKQGVYFSVNYTVISIFPMEDNIYWLKQDFIAFNNGYKINKDSRHSCLCSLYPIKTPYKELNRIHLTPKTFVNKQCDGFLSVITDNDKFFIDENRCLVYSITETVSNVKEVAKKDYPGIVLCEQSVYLESRDKCSTVVLVENGGKYSIGIWDEQLRRFKIDEELDNIIDKSSFANAMFSSENDGVLIKDKSGKMFRWMDNQGNLHDIHFDDSSYISKGINGYQPLISFDKSRRPVFVDPVTSNKIEPAYLRDYVFTSPDKSLYAENNIIDHIKYKNIISGEFISKGEYNKLKDLYDFPVYYSSLQDDIIKKEIRNKVSEARLNFIKEQLSFFEGNDFFSSSIIRGSQNDSKDEKIDKLCQASYVVFVDFFVRIEQYVIVHNAKSEIVQEIYTGDKLLFLNYVSFSKDNRYIAISGRYPNNSGRSGLLLIYDLNKKEINFNSDDFPSQYHAVWIAVFDNNGRIGSYSSEPITRFLTLNNGKYEVEEVLRNRNFLAFSNSGDYIALSDQGYVPFDKDPQNWGHQPSSNIYIYRRDGSLVGCYNDFGDDEGKNKKNKKSGIVGVGIVQETVASVSFSKDESRYLAVSDDGVVVVRNIS